MEKENQQDRINFPKLPSNQKWVIIGYLLGKNVRKCPLSLEDFGSLQYIGRSGDYFHIVGDINQVLVCSIIFR